VLDVIVPCEMVSAPVLPSVAALLSETAEDEEPYRSPPLVAKDAGSM
jgi:hypothetical protein